MKKVLIVTGGTGGHVIPSISLFEHLNKKFSVKIVSDIRGSRFIDKNKYNYELIDVPNLFNKVYLFPINIFKYAISIFKSIKFIKNKEINLVISTGGYMTFPICLAAYFLKKKIFLFEPNSVLGRSNKIALNFSNKIICYDSNMKNFPKKFNFKKIVFEPILRKEIYDIDQNNRVNIKNKKILVVGGSQGALFFDNKIVDIIIEISKKIKIDVNQQVSNKDSISLIKRKYDQANINYNFFEFSKSSKEIYEGVDLAITRGGANTLSELSYLKIPFISVPLPSSRDNHQYYNSNYYLKKDCCWIVEQKDFNSIEVCKLIEDVIVYNKTYIHKNEKLKKINENNTWNNINSNIIRIFDEN